MVFDIDNLIGSNIFGIMPNNFWIFLIITVLTGAWTGYITNDFAIKMLFKEYGFWKFKFGGVIVKTRRNLEKNISQLVEQEIINHNTIKKQLHKKEVRETISTIVNEFFNESLYEHSENSRLCDLPGYDKTVANIINFLDEYLEQNLSYIFLKIAKNVNLDDLVSEDQVAKVSSVLVHEIIAIVREDKVVENLVVELYNNYNEKSVEDLIGDKIVNVIVNNLNDLMVDLFEKLRYKYSRQIKVLINKIYEDIDFDKIVEKLEVDLGSRKFKEIISDEGIKKLYDMVNEYLHSDNSTDSIDVFCESIILALKNIRKPIIELFSGDLRKEIEKFLENHLPSIIDKLIEVVKQNSDEIEELIENSIDQTIDDQGAIRKLILSAIRVFLIENFTQKYDIINKMVQMLENIDVDNLSETVSQQVIHFLHEKNISDIIMELESNDLLSADLISKQVHRSLKYLSDRYLSDDIDHTEFLQKTVKDVFNIKLKTILNDTTVSFVTRQVVYNEGLFNKLKEKLNDSLMKIAKLPISEFVNQEKIASVAVNLQGQFDTNVSKKSSDIRETINNSLNKYLVDKDLSEILSKENVNLNSDSVKNIIVSAVNTVIEKNRKTKIHDLFNKVNSIENLGANAVDAIMDFLENGLDSVLKGNVSKLVEGNIKNLSNDEVLDMMEKFMGTKLKPLTIIGAILGGIVGGVIGFVGYGSAGVDGFVNMSVYAGLGWFTNVLAIFFIFRPYKPLFGIKPMQGIVAKQIPVFAKAMGSVVSENLLSENTINNIFANNEDTLKGEFKNNVKNEDYKVIREYLLDNTDSLIGQTRDYVLAYLTKNKRNLSTKLVDEAMAFDTSKIDTQVITSILVDIVVAKVNDMSSDISDYLLEKFKSSKTIVEILKELNITTVEDQVDQLVNNETIKFINLFKNNNYISDMIKKNHNNFDALVQKPLSEVLSESLRPKLEILFNNIIIKNVFAPKGQVSISQYVVSKLVDIFSNTNSIDELFGGKFIDLVNENMTGILDRIQIAMVEWLKKNEEDIYETVRVKVKDKLSLMQTVGYSAVSGDKLIQETVYRIIDERIPEFIRDKMASLNDEVETFFEELGRIQLKDVNIEFQEDGIYKYVKTVFESEEIRFKTQRFVHISLHHFYQLDTSKFFEMLDIYSIHDILLRFDKEIKSINKGIYEQLNDNREEVVRDLTLVINQLLNLEILSNKVRNLTLGLTSDEVLPFVVNVKGMLNDNNFLYNKCYDLTEKVVEHFTKLPVSDVINEKSLRVDVLNVLNKLSKSDEFSDTVHSVAYNLTSIVTEQLSTIIDESTSTLVLETVVNSVYDVISLYMNDLLNAVDLREITENEIKLMDPKEIKDLFDSFASNYFRKLESYGILGGFFAFYPVAIGTFIVYIVSAVSGDKSKFKSIS